MSKTRALLILLLGLLLALRTAPGQDGQPETPEQKARRLKALAGDVRRELDKVRNEDLVVRGDALEVILDIGADLREVKVEGFIDTIREAGLTAPDRFIAVLAGQVLNIVDPDGTIYWLKNKALPATTNPEKRANALAMISECPVKGAGDLAAKYVGDANEDTRVQALTALAKLRDPGTYPAMLAALGAREKEVKDNAAIALGCLGDPRAIPSLIHHLDDADGNHPAFAAWALKHFEDPRIFDAVENRLKSDSGEIGDAKARIVESCSMPQHKDKLASILTKNRFEKFRYAAAIALGRMAKDDLETQQLLLRGLARDNSERIRFACFFALSRNLSKEMGPAVVEELEAHLRHKKLDKQVAFRHLAMLAGDLRIPEAAPILLMAAKLRKNDLTWRISAVNFWKCADETMRKKLQEEFGRSNDERIIDRMAEIYGRSPRIEEFHFLTQQLRKFPEYSPASVSVEHGLEHMTGHFFGPYYGIWQKWLIKNEDFFAAKQYRIDRRKWQSEFGRKEREFRQTPKTERAVQLGLSWLSRHQNLQGALDPNRFFERCRHEPSCKKTGARHMLDPAGTTSLAALAFLGGGYSPNRGKYKDTLRRLLIYLQVRQTADGNFTTTDRFQGYIRPIAIYAFSEAFNVTGDPAWHDYIRRATEYLTEIQNELGGWKYQAGARTTDTSVMSWVLLGTMVAHKSGFPVREIVFEGCDHIMDMYSDPITGHEREMYRDIDPHYAYEVGEEFDGEFQTGYEGRVAENATTAFGLMARMFLGWRRSHPFCIGSANFILNRKMEELPKGAKRGKWDGYVSANRFPSYAWYYGTLAMHQMGGRFFRKWNAVIKELLPGIQNKEGCDAGSWAVLNYDFVAGKVYTTCMGVLTLETYYRYKPFCEEGMPEEEPEGR